MSTLHSGGHLRRSGFIKQGGGGRTLTIKQHLRIKRFSGTPENAVKTQIWIVVSAYVLVATVKKKLQLDASLYTLPQILSVTLFEKMPLQQAFPASECISPRDAPYNRLNLFAI